jgi:hypothetical protein
VLLLTLFSTGDKVTGAILSWYEESLVALHYDLADSPSGSGNEKRVPDN